MRASIALFLALAGAAHAQAAATEFVNGRWYDGDGFRADTFFAAGGVLTKHRPAGHVIVVDLHDGYVVPPFGDAHEHFPESAASFTWSNPVFLASGTFYILNPSEIARRTNPIRAELGGPGAVDVVFAHGGFTCTGGHPTLLFRRLIDQKYVDFPADSLEGNALYAIDSAADIAKKWPAFLATKPDFVKLYLLHSEEYARGAPDPTSKGLKPEFLPELVRRAHAAGLRAGAHIESATDFHYAVASGVDLIMHLPGYVWRPVDTDSVFLIKDTDIRLAAERHTIVVTTIDLADYDSAAIRDRTRRVQTENLRHLKAAGVPIVIGTDGAVGKVLNEVLDLHSTGVFTDAELVRMLTVSTPQVIFPQRRIGRLAEGYEASFVVVNADPTRDVAALKSLELRVKNGAILAP